MLRLSDWMPADIRAASSSSDNQVLTLNPPAGSPSTTATPSAAAEEKPKPPKKPKKKEVTALTAVQKGDDLAKKCLDKSSVCDKLAKQLGTLPFGKDLCFCSACAMFVWSSPYACVLASGAARPDQVV